MAASVAVVATAEVATAAEIVVAATAVEAVTATGAVAEIADRDSKDSNPDCVPRLLMRHAVYQGQAT